MAKVAYVGKVIGVPPMSWVAVGVASEGMGEVRLNFDSAAEINRDWNACGHMVKRDQKKIIRVGAQLGSDPWYKPF
jgi:hypothetical protein